MEDVVILSAARTPIGTFQGALASFPAHALGAKAAPDGYTLTFVFTPIVMSPYLYSDAGYKLSDFAPITQLVVQDSTIAVNPSLPVKNLTELIAYVKAHPGQISLASFGTGTISHVAGVLFKMKADVEMVHVPYRGSAPLVIGMLAGEVQAAVDNLQSSVEYISAGKLRALAVTTATRSPRLPDVPTLGEFLPGYEVNAWIGIGVPKSTPAEVVDKLNKEINAGLVDTNIAARVAGLVSTPFIASPAEVDKLVVEQTAMWAKVVKSAGIKAE